MRTIKPAPTQVCVKPSEKETKTKSGLFLPEAKDALPPNTAAVVAVGKDAGDYKVGDEVVFKQFTATEISVEHVSYALIDHRDILGVIVG